MTVYEVRNRLNELLNTGQITGNEVFGLWEYSYEEGDYFWTPDELNISDGKAKYVHRCPKCGNIEWLPTSYPCIEYR